MISDIRTFISTQILALYPDFREWKDAFNIENIPSTIFNKSFHIFYTIPNADKMQTTIMDSIDVTLKLFFKGERDTQIALDSAMDTAHLIRLNIISKSATPSGYLSIDNNSIEASPLESNDNKIVITLTFTAKKYFTNC